MGNEATTGSSLQGSNRTTPSSANNPNNPEPPVPGLDETGAMRADKEEQEHKFGEMTKEIERYEAEKSAVWSEHTTPSSRLARLLAIDEEHSRRVFEIWSSAAPGTKCFGLEQKSEPSSPGR